MKKGNQTIGLFYTGTRNLQTSTTVLFESWNKAPGLGATPDCISNSMLIGILLKSDYSAV